MSSDNVRDYLYSASICPANEASVQQVLNAPVDEDDYGRSKYHWIRLANGDLILGVYPMGDLYEMVSISSQEDFVAAEIDGTVYHVNIDAGDAYDQGFTITKVPVIREADEIDL